MRTILLLGMAMALNVTLHAQGLKDLFNFKKSTTNSLAGLSQDQVANGLKEALSRGVQHAVTNLGRSGGYLNDLNVRIPMPESLQKAEKTLRSLGQNKLADDFIVSMNNAAEQAVPQAASVLGDSIKRMSVADAKGILLATNNAATEYFRRTSETNLHARFLPIVKAATEQVGATRAYKQMMEKVDLASLSGLGNLRGLGGKLVNPVTVDVDEYVTKKALDGLFIKIADQEKLIRQDPVARTSDLLQKVFGAVAK